MNPIKKARKDKGLGLNELAKLLGSNHFTLTKVERGDCLSSTYLTIIRKMSLEFEDIDDRILLKEYRNWLNNKEVKADEKD